MGLFDCRCMATGVSLKGADAALVLLQKSGRRSAPIGLAVKGNYDRLGSIDGIEEDANTRRLLAYFLECLQSRTFLVDEGSLKIDRCFPIRKLEHLLRGFERGMNAPPGHKASLRGLPVEFALIAQAVWDAIAKSAPPPVHSAANEVERLFADSPVGLEIYSGAPEEVSLHLQDFGAVDAFLRSREVRWRATKADEQHYGREVRRYLGAARRAFADSPAVSEGLNRYADDNDDLDDED